MCYGNHISSVKLALCGFAEGFVRKTIVKRRGETLLQRFAANGKGIKTMKKHLFSAALLLLLMLLIPVTASADALYPAPETLYVGDEVDCLLAALDAGGTVWHDPGQLPPGLRLESEESDAGIQVYLRGKPTQAGDYDVVILYNGSASKCSLHITDPAVVALSLETLPLRTQYVAGDTLDPAGLSLRAELSDGASRIVTDPESFSLYPTRLENAGTQRIEVNYRGRICYFDVEVTPSDEEIEGIGVLTLPEKTVYFRGETLVTSGLSIRVYTNNGTRDVGAEDLVCSPMLLTEAGLQLITVEYRDKSCTFLVTVEEEAVPSSLSIVQMPLRRDYVVGDTLDTEGMILLLSEAGVVAELSDGFDCEPKLLDTPGTQEIVVRYGDLDCSFEVYVDAATQIQNVQPHSGQFSVRDEPQGAEPVRNQPGAEAESGQLPGDGKALLAGVILAAALGTLAILAVYVLLINRSGREYFAVALRELLRRRR